MKVTDFSIKVSRQEGLKKGVDIAQISEVLKVANNILGGELYAIIKKHGDASPSEGRVVTNKKVSKTKKKSVSKGKKS